MKSWVLYLWLVSLLPEQLFFFFFSCWFWCFSSLHWYLCQCKIMLEKLNCTNHVYVSWRTLFLSVCLLIILDYYCEQQKLFDNHCFGRSKKFYSFWEQQKFHTASSSPAVSDIQYYSRNSEVQWNTKHLGGHINMKQLIHNSSHHFHIPGVSWYSSVVILKLS